MRYESVSGITLSNAELSAIDMAISSALADQRAYLEEGNMLRDYGSGDLQAKAAAFDALSAVAAKLGFPAHQSDCEQFAYELREAVGASGDASSGLEAVRSVS